MNRKYYSALAVSAVAMGAVVLTATEASAEVAPEPGSTSQEYSYPNYDPAFEVPPANVAKAQSSSDDNGVEVVQSSASALGGAALALGGVWLYRRRQLRTN